MSKLKVKRTICTYGGQEKIAFPCKSTEQKGMASMLIEATNKYKQVRREGNYMSVPTYTWMIELEWSMYYLLNPGSACFRVALPNARVLVEMSRDNFHAALQVLQMK